MRASARPTRRTIAWSRFTRSIVRRCTTSSPHLGDEVVHLRTIDRVKRDQAMVRRVGRAEARIRRIVAKLPVLNQVPHGVDAESIDPAPKPVTHHLVDGRPDGRVAPVEIWLSGEKGVIVKLSACAIIFPGAAAEY